MLTVTKSLEAIAMPQRRRYAFEDMLIGDSMHFLDFRQAESARVAAIRYAKRQGKAWRFGIRTMSDGWRIFRLQ